ncbi:Asp-tRNA(Asn)/Glu-tRNA(Gln) amidotransferase subunit GatB [Rickettsiales bacterium]|nr:Asp-tRNA(Asn)/Glu-tRNA(Gln) amidotransferase subunit GatB [Rickettsiales bacterium]
MGYFIQGIKEKWEVVLGLEVHAQISASSKLFSSASTAYGAIPNSQVNLVDAGMPGALPVINKECVRQAIITGLGLNAKINLKSIFDRKNYFYPDLPQGYQISQFEHPIVGEGFINIETDEGTKKIGITRLHLEQDAGKSLHDQDFDNSFIDLNRSGCALMEIVSEPDLRSPLEASEYVKKLRSILRYVGSCDGNMEKGNLRADVNVSVRRFGSDLGTRCEIKNVNSIKFIQQAIDYEAKRQVKILESGREIQQQTRLFDSQNCETRAMRSKEESHDYRYFPDPDLPPLLIDSQLVEELSKSLPELPDKKKERFIKEFGIKNYDAEILVTEKFIADFFEELIPNRDPKLVLSWLTGELFSYLNKRNLNIVNSGISANKLGNLIDLIQNGTLSNRMAKEIFEEYLDNDKSAIDLVNEKGMTQVSDDKEIDLMIDKVLEENPKILEQYNSGKEKLFGFFVGQVMKISNGKANPQMVNNLLSKKLK